MKTFRPRVLIIAEACNPAWVSVPLVGWSCSQALAEVAQTHLVTHVRNRPDLINAGLKEGGDFTAIDSDFIAGPFHWLATKLRGGAGRGWTTVTAFRSLSHYYFEHLVWKRFGREIREGRFDIVHRLTPLTPTAPSLIAKRCAAAGVPFVIGPLNGGLPWPKGHAAMRRREGEWSSWVRGLHRWLPAYRATRRHAAAIIVGSEATLQQVPRAFQNKCVYIPENGVHSTITSRPARDGRCPLRVAFVGRLVDYKNPDVVVEAVAPLALKGQATLDIYGDGPLLGKLSKLVEERTLGETVRVRGWTPHEQMSAELRGMDVLAFPSVREFGGAVVLEAMAMGVVPVVVDYGGPAELAGRSGYRIPVMDHDGLVLGLHSALTAIANDRSILSGKCQSAVARVDQWFTWQAKARQIRDVYRWVTGEQSRKPDFGVPFPDGPADLGNAPQHRPAVRNREDIKEVVASAAV